MVSRNLKQTVGDRQSERAAGRVMRQRLREEDLGPIPRDLSCQIVEIRAVRPAPDARHLDARELQLAEERIVAGAVDKDCIAGLQEMADDQVEGVVGAESHQDLRWRDMDRALRQHQSDLGAQRWITRWVAVAVLCRRIALAGAHAQMAAEFGILHPGRWRASVSDADGMDLAKLLAQQRNDVDRLGHMRRSDVVGALARRPNEKAGAAPRLEPPLRDQPVIDLDHGVLRDAVFFRRGPQRPHALAGLKQALFDRTDDARNDAFGSVDFGLLIHRPSQSYQQTDWYREWVCRQIVPCSCPAFA